VLLAARREAPGPWLVPPIERSSLVAILWGGLLLNALAFACGLHAIDVVIVRPLGALSRRLDAWVRIRTAQAASPSDTCPACGYDLAHGGSVGCPECGWGRRDDDDGCLSSALPAAELTQDVEPSREPA
jgi:hypothetical protein